MATEATKAKPKVYRSGDPCPKCGKPLRIVHIVQCETTQTVRRYLGCTTTETIVIDGRKAKVIAGCGRRIDYRGGEGSPWIVRMPKDEGE